MRFLEKGVVKDIYSLKCESQIDITIEFKDDCYKTNRDEFITFAVGSRRVSSYSFRWLNKKEGLEAHHDQIEMWGFLDMRGDEKLTTEDYDVKRVLLWNGKTNVFGQTGVLF